MQFISDDKSSDMPDKPGGFDLPYSEGLRMDEAMNPLCLLTFGCYGEVLPNQNGAPIRVVSPWKYGFKNGKVDREDQLHGQAAAHAVERHGGERIWFLLEREPERWTIRGGRRRTSGESIRARFRRQSQRKCSTDTATRLRACTRAWT